MIEELIACPVCNASKISPFLDCADHFLSKEIFTIVKCEQCGFLFTNPRPSADQLGNYYQSPEYISHSNAKKGMMNLVYQRVRKYTISRKHKIISKISTGKRILDIGCATGEFLNFMNLKDWETVGIEPDQNARKQAIESYNLKIFDESYIKEIPESSFDVITLWHVLEHVSDLEGRMKDLYRLLKPQGILVIAVPNSKSHDAEFYKSFWASYDVPRHLYHFSTSTMEKLLTRFSFDLIKILPMKFDAFYVSMLSEKYKSGKVNLFRSLWNGFYSNWLARGKTNHSSLIFISRKA
jgi:2-polyprenyl-3-methyl-5-hydroxy-6-metoxy-1,4-benzoquinol methylase